MMQEQLPFITICMPVYNSNWSLNFALESILNIDYPKKLLRLVFVDSYSTDGTWEILQRFKEKHEAKYESIILVRTPKRGLGHAMNICLKYVKDWVFWAESDRLLPPEILRHLLKHFERDLKVGWAHSAWTRENPTFYERVMLSRFVPKSYRYVDEIEAACSLVRPEAIKAFGSFYEDGGVPFDSYEAAEQFVRLRKSGWKIINDGQLSQKCIHLTHREGGWGKLVEGRSFSMAKTLIKRLLGMAHYYFMKTPKRPVHEMIRAGDIKLALKITYWITLPYVVLSALASHLWWALLYALPPIIIYAYETNGLTMKFITPLVQIFR